MRIICVSTELLRCAACPNGTAEATLSGLCQPNIFDNVTVQGGATLIGNTVLNTLEVLGPAVFDRGVTVKGVSRPVSLCLFAEGHHQVLRIAIYSEQNIL